MDLEAQLRSSLVSQHLPTPSPQFLSSVTSTRSPPPPLTSLLATAKSRILACDLASSIPGLIDASVPSLPASADDARIEEARLPRPVHVQILDVENLAQSKWEQIEELEAIERGEMTRGRHVIRVTADEDDSSSTQQQQAAGAGLNATHRLVVQDCAGKRVYAIEVSRIQKLGVGKTAIGEKLLLRAGTVIARGSILLEPDKVVFLGGKVDEWHENWTTGRLKRLKELVEQQKE